MIKIEIITKVTDEIVEAISALIPQLTSSSPKPSTDYLQRMLDSNTTTLFVAKENNNIVGMLSLVIYLVPSGKKSWIEDVVSDSGSRGKGIAKQLIQEALKFAEEQGLTKVDLTSNNQRLIAHKLYEKLDFEKRDTSVFRKTLD